MPNATGGGVYDFKPIRNDERPEGMYRDQFIY